jgi:cytoskeletal protein RodZ
MTVLGILIVGGLLFGVFTGTKWAYGKLTDDGKGVATTGQTTTSGPSITATSSTSTTTPSPATTTPTPVAPTVAQPTTTPTVVATAAAPSKKIPQTGAGSNTALFISVAVLGYFLYRRRALKN